MESKAKVAGHAVHPMLVAFPIGLLLTALVFDIIYLVSDEPRWAGASWYMIAAGVIGGLASAIPGLIDWFAIPAATRAKRVGLIHAIGNVVVLGLFFLSWLLRADAPGALPAEAIAAEFLGAGLLAVTGWLGGELVNRLGVGVDDGAHLDAPSSLSGGAERRHSPQPAYAGVERRVYRSGR